MLRRPRDSEIRFEFGKNWKSFLGAFNETRLNAAQESLVACIPESEFAGSAFLDAGCGSGLFSLAARRLGARVVSLDFDEDSVECAMALRSRWFPEDDSWEIERESILSERFQKDERKYHVVYSWGVLHHTGDMWSAMRNTMDKVARGGWFVISIYNDQGWLSRYWHGIKTVYNRSRVLRPFLVVLHAPYFIAARFVYRAISGRGKLERGMSYWNDMIDWLGGMPFEVARPEKVIEFVLRKEFRVVALKTCGGRSGCNEFVFRKD